MRPLRLAVIERFARFPAALASQTRAHRFGDATALIAHPDWESPAPIVLWLHGRTASKELDPGRYLRWIRAGFAACAVDLPGHGERADSEFQSASRTLGVLEQARTEIDEVVHALGEPRFNGVFDLDRIGIGGMSAGGMATLRRLCDPHRFRCAAVEGTTGNLAGHYAQQHAIRHPSDRIAENDPMQHLGGWRPIPLLVVHSEADRVVPFASQRQFVERLREHYTRQGSDPSAVEVLTWPETGAPEEHMGFGRHANDAKNAQTAFFQRHFALN